MYKQCPKWLDDDLNFAWLMSQGIIPCYSKEEKKQWYELYQELSEFYDDNNYTIF